MRGLSPGEAALWDRVARTVTPISGRQAAPQGDDRAARAPVMPVGNPRQRGAAASPSVPAAPRRQGNTASLDRGGLDAGWDRRLARGLVAPDFTLDLHGCTLDAAHARLDHGLALALAQDARLVLVITGRARMAQDHAEASHHGRGDRRGAIRAKFLDWLMAGPQAGRIAAIRPAHPRHGGAGAVYLVMRRQR